MNPYTLYICTAHIAAQKIIILRAPVNRHCQKVLITGCVSHNSNWMDELHFKDFFCVFMEKYLVVRAHYTPSKMIAEYVWQNRMGNSCEPFGMDRQN